MGFRLRRRPPLNAKREAYPYQLDAVRAVQSLQYAAVFHEQGLGKTKIAIDLVLFWLSRDVVDTVFIVTKKSLVKNWVDELAAHSWVTPAVLSDDSPREQHLSELAGVSLRAELRSCEHECRVASPLSSNLPGGSRSGRKSEDQEPWRIRGPMFPFPCLGI